MKGWEFYFNLKKNPESAQQKKGFKILPKNRVYSLSSVNSQVARGLEKDDKTRDIFKPDLRSRKELESDESFSQNDPRNKKKKIQKLKN